MSSPADETPPRRGRVGRLLARLDRWYRAHTARAAIAMTVAVLILMWSPISGENVPGTPVVDADKVAHAILFALLVVAWWRAAGTRLRRLLEAWLIVLVIGGVTELVQAWLPYRHGSWADWWADVVGATLATLAGIAHLWFRRHGRPAARR